MGIQQLLLAVHEQHGIHYARQLMLLEGRNARQRLTSQLVQQPGQCSCSPIVFGETGTATSAERIRWA